MIEAFGPERCLWGSDWPVVNVQRRRPADLDRRLPRRILAGYSEAEQAAMAHGTAERVYGVSLPD